MGIEIFRDPLGQSIKAKLMTYAAEHYSTPPEQLEAAVERTHLIVEAVKEACIDALESEISVMSFRNVNANEELIPVTFMAGVLHALDVIKTGTSIIDIESDNGKEA